MKRLICSLIIIFFATAVYADKIIIPFSCYPKEIQKRFAEKQKKVDLSQNDREQDSWAFIRSNGSDYEICTYAPVTIEELELIKSVVMPQAEKICQKQQ
jgi:hypothetical protein